MPVRYPPGNQTSSRTARDARMVSYVEPRQSFLRRVLRKLLSPYFVIPVVFVSAIVIGILVYYWTVFSARIDNLLKGEVFTRSAGIYAAPKQIRAGQNVSQDDLLAYLKRVGYVERGQQGESARGRYVIDGATVQIDPGQDSVLDNARPFEPLQVQFARGGKS